jgi:hypothetical protein
MAKRLKKDKAMARRAADYIVRMENVKDAAGAAGEGWQVIGPRFQQLLEREQPLREIYDELKKNAK